jgi:aspartyl-tRNA(Asn)/glutamyl-tRNA(Gln) amidotransferase subunit A
MGVVRELAAALRRADTSSLALVNAALRRADETAPLNAFITLDGDGARAAAQVADRELQGGHDRGPLHGIPVAVKDNILTAGLPTTCGSRLLQDFVSPDDATVVRRLREAGAVIIGKTNLDEFAMGSSSENSAFGPVLNPRDPTRVAGGSSGGSAAAVAAGVVPIALGSDTGGSVRQPAAFCGVVGFRPTWGTVSRSGLVAFASSLDQVGPFGADVDSARLAWEAIVGLDEAEATSWDAPTPEGPPDAVRVGVPQELSAVLPVEGRALLDAAVAELGGGVPVSLPSTRFGAPAYYVLSSAEASSNLARFDGIRYGRRGDADDLDQVYRRSRSDGFGAEVQRRILLGTFALAEGYRDAYYEQALNARARVRAEFDAAFEEVDVLLSLTAPETAFPLGAKQDPVAMYRSDVLTIPASLAGVPAISLPWGRTDLPWGVQVMGAPGADALVLAVAARLEAGIR